MQAIPRRLPRAERHYRAFVAALPDRDFVYLGDTARLPYGTKSAASVVRYAGQAVDALVARGLSYLVIACNTASAVALPALRAHYAPLPVLGVLEPGAAAACAGLTIVDSAATTARTGAGRCVCWRRTMSCASHASEPLSCASRDTHLH